MRGVSVLEAGEQRVTMVVCDLGRVFAPDWVKRLGRDAKDCGGTPRDRLWSGVHRQ